MPFIVQTSGWEYGCIHGNNGWSHKVQQTVPVVDDTNAHCLFHLSHSYSISRDRLVTKSLLSVRLLRLLRRQFSINFDEILHRSFGTRKGRSGSLRVKIRPLSPLFFPNFAPSNAFSVASSEHNTICGQILRSIAQLGSRYINNIKKNSIALYVLAVNSK